MASSSDEGEIVEHSDLDLKATSLPKKLDGSGVDRTDRQRIRYSASRSPEYGQARHRTSRRSRSPPRSQKRPREEDDHRARPDHRRFQVRYEDPDRDPEVKRRTQAPYDDPGRYSPRTSGHHNATRARDRSRDRSRQRENDRVRYPDRGTRRRSRSPATELPTNERVRERERDGRRWRDGGRPEHSGGRSGGQDAATPGSSRHPKETRVSVPLTHQGRGNRPEHSTNEQTPEGADPDVDFEEVSIIDEDAEIERRRRRRAELLAKSSASTPLLINVLQAAAEKSSMSSPAQTDQGTPLVTGAGSPQSDIASPGPGTPHNHGEHSPALEITSEIDLINRHAGDAAEDGPSAADYDPTADMREDGIRDELRNGHVGLHGEELQHSAADPLHDSAKVAPPVPQEGSGRSARDEDDDEDFDMFADDFDEEKYAPPKQSSADVVVEDKAAPVLAPAAGGILEGDDKEGYYKIRIGELLNGRYQVQSMLGKGMFSGVARAVDIKTKNTVAIKIMRNNDALRKGGFIEINILQKLNAADPEGRKHIVRFEHHFDHKGHLCMAFENLSLNLREVLRKFGNNVGINLGATRAYAHQIFVGLAHMRKCSIIHADLKPDNILVNESRNILKICDLGTGIDRSDAATAHNEVTPYLVSRFYRAPEVILGMPYDYAIDMWSIGCTLYEMYTGKILFAGDSNNQMLKAIMEIRGRFTPKLFKRGQLSSMHFDEQGNFISVERDKALGKTAVRTLSIVKPTRDLRTRLLAVSAGMSETESKDLNHFIDLLEHCLALNPEKRIKPADALRHPFFTSRSTQAK